ncbi:MAG: glycosyl transferase [Bacteroidetes bacterium]|nr:glycosyl transferase [Bacteroidota bacterium]MBU1483254.1 glycosyl transferase [Bacteroidota bacterium]MBU2268835.1 glycosyl transferase [Bacteroidota bacterium]MBU2377176.1 glycosyl transferase [Bacteroidota bacterium]
MAIPKVIYQTFKSKELPLITKWHIKKFLKNNPEYIYEFYDDLRIEEFFESNYDSEWLKAYQKLNIGAAKADFFRYAILYKKGGVYLDIDSGIKGKLSAFIKPDDKAIISMERNDGVYIQWALIFEAGHPFLKETLELVKSNIDQNLYPHDVHGMTGPTAYTKAINNCLGKTKDVSYRILGIDYEGHLQFKYKLGKFFLYKKGDHWKKQQLIKPVLKNIDQ